MNVKKLKVKNEHTTLVIPKFIPKFEFFRNEKLMKNVNKNFKIFDSLSQDRYSKNQVLKHLKLLTVHS